MTKFKLKSSSSRNTFNQVYFQLFSRSIKPTDQRSSLSDFRSWNQLYLFSFLLPVLQLLVVSGLGGGDVQYGTRQRDICHSARHNCHLGDSGLSGSGHRLTPLRLHISVSVGGKYVKELHLQLTINKLNKKQQTFKTNNPTGCTAWEKHVRLLLAVWLSEKKCVVWFHFCLFWFWHSLLCFNYHYIIFCNTYRQ